MLFRPLAVLAAAVALWSSPAAAADEEAPEEQDTAPHAELAPTRAAAHADCDDRMPLWEHTVSAGEHLGIIAGRYGVRQADLLRLNPQIANPDLIVIGAKLRVCPEIYPRERREVTHVVAAGETLSEIAEAYGLSLRELLAAVADAPSNPDRLRVGTTLVFSVDGGLVEDFLPPLPKPPKADKHAKRGAGGKRRGHVRSKVSVQLVANDDLHVKRPNLAWGTAKTISLLGKVVTDYKNRARGGPKVLIGDISQRGGGKLQPHLSHQHGNDIDVGYVLEGADGRRTRFSGVTLDNLDHRRTWALVKAFLDTNEVRYIFMDYQLQKALYDWALEHGESQRLLDEVFQYPRGRGRNHGIIRHWRSHRHHFHVRFR